MTDVTPQLKRKREGSGAHQKRTKKQKKAEELSLPTHFSTPEPKRDTALPSQETTVSEVAPTSPLATKRKNKKNKPKKQEKNPPESQDAGPQVEAHISPADAPKDPPRKSKKRTEAEINLNGTNQDGHHGASGSRTDDTSIPSTTQISHSNKAEKKKEKRDKKSRKEKQLEKAAKSDLSKTLNSNSKEKGKFHLRTSEKWALSPLQGGWFLPTDPVFSSDEEYLFLASPKSLQIYATDTSTLTNTLPVKRGGVLSAFALSSAKPNLVYIADSTGFITLWDWVDGSKIGKWKIGVTVQNMKVIRRPGSDEDLVYCQQSGDNDIVSVYAPPKYSKNSTMELKTVMNINSSICGIQLLLQGEYIILNCTESIVIAKRSSLSNADLGALEYVWRELRFSNKITTCSAYLRKPAETSNGKKNPQGARDILDIAIGDETGAILLFEDILPTFAAIESDQKGNKNRTDDAENFRPKRLHWHREAVGAVKWSLDGNYLISGGDETVLTIWQLATGELQHLPHLTAAIENIVVSPSGSAYGVTLANNSVIVLSTVELEAKTNIIGNQSRRVDLERLFEWPRSIQEYWTPFSHVPMAVNPQNPNEILFSVPSSQSRSKNENLRPEPYLQTFDLANQRAKPRQALTRNNATDINLSPEGGRVLEPSVKLLQVSHDGQWLATVDEWIPSRTDAVHLNEGIPEFNEENRLQHREVYLKMWRHDVDRSQWKLETRIDAPHFFEDKCANGIVFDLVADPAVTGFATLGEDHVVRIWRPKTRFRDGLVVRGTQEQGLVTWSLSRAIEISDKFDAVDDSEQSLAPLISRLAFSGDGSVLAAAVSRASESECGIIHLIDPNTATINRTITEIDVTALAGLGVIGRHLVVVGDSITVWDMVLDQFVYFIPITTPNIDRFERIPLLRLAINETDNTFAIAIPQLEKKDALSSKWKKPASTVSVFNIEHQDALWSSTAQGVTLALVSRRSDRGYIALDSRSCVQTITPSAASIQLPTPPPEAKGEPRRKAITGNEVEKDQPIQPILKPLLLDDLSQDLEDEKPVLNQQSLQEVLDNGAAPLPPHRLFNVILALVGGAPKIAV